MNEKQTIRATVLSSTIIRVPGAAHAASAPFILLLVEADAGMNMLGHFRRNTATFDRIACRQQQ